VLAKTESKRELDGPRAAFIKAEATVCHILDGNFQQDPDPSMEERCAFYKRAPDQLEAGVPELEIAEAIGLHGVRLTAPDKTHKCRSNSRSWGVFARIRISLFISLVLSHSSSAVPAAARRLDCRGGAGTGWRPLRN